MSLLTEAQIRSASDVELLQTVKAINSHLDGSDASAVLRTTRDTLAAHGFVGQLCVTVGVDEWDDGYFYSGVDYVANEQGAEIALPPAALAELEAELEEPLTELSRNGPALGRFARCTIDLNAWTINR